MEKVNVRHPEEEFQVRDHSTYLPMDIDHIKPEYPLEPNYTTILEAESKDYPKFPSMLDVTSLVQNGSPSSYMSSPYLPEVRAGSFSVDPMEEAYLCAVNEKSLPKMNKNIIVPPSIVPNENTKLQSSMMTEVTNDPSMVEKRNINMMIEPKREMNFSSEMMVEEKESTLLDEIMSPPMLEEIENVTTPIVVQEVKGKAIAPRPQIPTKGMPWTEDEHRLFLMGMQVFGRKWTKIANNYVITRSASQVASHAQKFFVRQQTKKKHRLSILDITTITAPSPKRTRRLSLYDIPVYNKSFRMPPINKSNCTMGGGQVGSSSASQLMDYEPTMAQLTQSPTPMCGVMTSSTALPPQPPLPVSSQLPNYSSSQSMWYTNNNMKDKQAQNPFAPGHLGMWQY